MGIICKREQFDRLNRHNKQCAALVQIILISSLCSSKIEKRQ